MPNDDDKTTFAVPDTRGEPPLFLGLMYAATRSEEELKKPGHGPGTPLYNAYIFPYRPSIDEKQRALTEGKELPLFVSYIFPSPNEDKQNVVLAGEGGHSALGGIGGQALFLGEVFSFVADGAAPPQPGEPPQ
jgi:hypothetical protein